MRTIIFSIIFVLVFIPPVSAKEVYVCPMHPHIHGEEGETCPICGMKLMPKAHTNPASTPVKNQSVQPGQVTAISPDFIQALGVKTGVAGMHMFGANIRAFGEIVPSTRNEVAVNMRSEGWVVELATDAVGDTVEKGDLLFTYYSPDLMVAQTDYLIESRSGSPIGDIESRLRLYGMDDKALAEFKAKRRIMEQTPFYAPIDGTVVTLNVRKGSFVEAGELVLSLQDFSQVWVNAAVPIRDLQFLSEGQQAVVTVPETGKRYPSRIDFIHHVANPESRTAIVRLVLHHERGEPKPGAYVDVEFTGEPGERLSVPAQAILYGEEGARVFLALGEGRFRPLKVDTGITAGGYTEILSGLQAGQNIVVSGQFLIDAESNLRGGMQQMEEMGGEQAMPATAEGPSHEH